MKKKLLVLAIATALPMGAAQAGVTIYGKIHASIDYVSPDSVFSYDADEDFGDRFDTNDDAVWNVVSRASRIGFKGSEDLGDGLKLIWKVESGVNLSDGDGTWSARNRYIGLAGGWGTFLYGRHDTPMKMSTGKLDIFSDTLADYNVGSADVGGDLGKAAFNPFGFTDVRANDAIAYVSPSWSGLTLAGAIIPDGSYDADGDLAGGYSVAAMWNISSFYLAAAYEDIGALADYLDADVERWRIGGGYDIGGFHMGLVYENEVFDLGPLPIVGYPKLGTEFEADKLQISGSYTFGNNAVKAMWLRSDLDASVAAYFSDGSSYTEGGSEKLDTWAVGWDYNFSKRSKMYALYANSDANLQQSQVGVGEQDGFSMGMVHKF